MSSELRLKKLRGSGGYVMANVTDEQQMKGNLGGPDLFLAPITRLDADKISKYFCNTCDKEFKGPPKIEFENPNEVVAENLILVEKGQYICNSCNSTIAEYRDFKKQDEAVTVGNAKPLDPQIQNESQQITETTQDTAIQQPTPQQPDPQPTPQQPDPQPTPQQPDPQPTPQQPTPQQPTPQQPETTSVNSIDGKSVYDENANKIGVAKHVGFDSTQSIVLIITKNDSTENSIPWNGIKKIGEIILLGAPEPTSSQLTPTGRCSSCGFSNKEGSKFCEECGTKLD